ncbi:peptidase M23 [Pilimelia terevasa]|uniref:Peptidase M23 n=1 Tax=Pilimelia terevasa TaxID=53372 RepID=A0A8J3BN35_9ACTN|nr:LysM peptidoglycan-binding domain-containing protein [Pilimelia terevasa]GGK23317.1 peptidase M23 [Pilimelia terevasa]
MSPSPVAFTAAGAAPAGRAGGAPPALTHAYLELREPPPAGSTAAPGPPRGRIDFQFNPRELAVAKSARWKRDAQKGAKKSGVPEFTGADPCKLTLEMFFDATDRMDEGVVRSVERLFTCCVPTASSLDARKPSPPWVIFRWGGLTGFPAFVSQVAVKYTLFTPGGLPVRATCTVTIEEIAGEAGGQNPTSGAVTAHCSRVVVAGDTLASIAQEAYGDPLLWRRLAQVNGVDDPLRLAPGRALVLPAAEELAPADGGGPDA